MNTESIFLAIAVLIVIVAISKHGLFGVVALFALVSGIACFGFDVTGPVSVLLGIIALGLSLNEDSNNSGPIVITEAMRKADRDLCERPKHSRPYDRYSNDKNYGRQNRDNGYIPSEGKWGKL